MFEVAQLDFWGGEDNYTCELVNFNDELLNVDLRDVELMQSTGLVDVNGKEIFNRLAISNIRHYTMPEE